MSFRLPRTYAKGDRVLFAKLRESAFFAELSNLELSRLTPSLYPRTFAENEALFFLGDPAQAVYFIESGSTELSIDAGERRELLQTKTAGNVVGTSAFLDDTRRLAHCVATEETQVLALATVDLQALYRQYPSLKAKLLSVLAEIQQRWLYRTLETYRREHGLFELEHLFRG